jgi:hypothetical protein
LDDAEFDFTDHGVATDAVVEIMKGGNYFLAALRSLTDEFDATQHAISNIFRGLDGASALMRCYVYAERFLAYDRDDPRVTRETALKRDRRR